MNQWQQHFTDQMDKLCSQSSTWYERFAHDVLEPAVDSLSSFLSRWHFEVSSPRSDSERRVYRFSLTENGYLLIWFRSEGFDALECEYEYSLPGIGRVAGTRTTGSLREADQDWVEACFQAALDAFVAKFVEMGSRKTAAELVSA